MKRVLILAAVAVAAIWIYRRRAKLALWIDAHNAVSTPPPAPDFTHGGLLGSSGYDGSGIFPGGLLGNTPAALTPPATIPAISIAAPPPAPPGVGPAPLHMSNAPTYTAPAITASTIRGALSLAGIAGTPADPAPVAPPPGPRQPTTPPRQSASSNDATQTIDDSQIIPDPAPPPRPAPAPRPAPRPAPPRAPGTLPPPRLSAAGAGGAVNNAPKQIMGAKDVGGGRIRSVPRNASDGN